MMNAFVSLSQSVMPSIHEFEREPQIFAVDGSKSIKFPRAVSHVQICNGILVAAITSSTGNSLIKMNLNSTDRRMDSIQIVADPSDHVSSLFMDPEGRHVLINMQANGDNFYFHTAGSDRVKPLPKLRGRINSVAWNKRSASASRENDTGPILLGTEEGALMEVQISLSEGLRYSKQLFIDPKISIHGILLETLPPTKSNSKPLCFLLFVSAGRLYQRVGEISATAPIYQNLFPQADESGIPIAGVKYMEFPRDFGYSFLRWHPMYDSALPTSLVWATGPGLYLSGLDLTGSTAMYDNVFTRTALIKYPPGNVGLPTGVQLTPFHILVSFTDSIKAINVINERIVFSHQAILQKDERLMGLVRDPVDGSVFIQTSFALYPIQINNESRNVWRLYLDAKQYDLAKSFCQTLEQVDTVLVRQAEDSYEKSNFVDAAKIYSRTSLSFEEVALKFVQLQEDTGLMTYLQEKVRVLNEIALKQQSSSNVAASEGDLANLHRLPVLAMWLVEIYLSHLARLTSDSPTGRESVTRQQFLKEFHSFLVLPAVLECLRLQPQLVYSLMDSHGNGEEKVYFAKLLGDHERVVEQYVSESNYSSALDEIVSQKATALYYKYASILVKHLPDKTINAWIKKGPALKPKRLVHALLQADAPEAQRYLEYATGPLQCRDEEVHNLLISVYAATASHGGNGLMKLLTYLKLCESSMGAGDGEMGVSSPLGASMGMGIPSMGLLPHEFPFDPQYALRVCAEHGLVDALVKLHSMFGMHQEAVQDALSKDDIALAKEITKTPWIDEETKKQLWLRIARHVVQEKNDIKEATALIKESELLKLEDVLPFFPDFVTIEHFKDAICESLDLYNQQIEKMKADMQEATAGAAEIRRQMHQLRNRYVTVELGDECAHCKYPLLMRTFYLFPCGHYFHTDCLADLVKPKMSPKDKKRFMELLDTLTHSPKGMASPTIRAEIDDLIAGDCYFCGDMAIESVNEPLFDGDAYERELASWE